MHKLCTKTAFYVVKVYKKFRFEAFTKHNYYSKIILSRKYTLRL